MIEKKVIDYIAGVQPKLEKYAQQNELFLSSLKNKLDTSVKMGSLTENESLKIIKEAQEDPSTVFKYFDVPSYNRQMGVPTGVAKRDALVTWLYP